MSEITKSIETRIAALEARQKKPVGTQITRIMTEGGLMWSFGLGQLRTPLAFFLGETIDEAVRAAELEVFGEEAHG